MLTKYELSFENGTLLTSELLTELYKTPLHLADMLAIDYSDGVISGIELRTKDGELVISRGLYKLGGELFVLLDEEHISPEGGFKAGIHYYLTLQEREPECNEKEPNIRSRTLEFKVMTNTEYKTESSKLLAFFTGIPTLPSKDHIIPANFDLTPYEHSCRGDEPTYAPQLFLLIADYLSEKDDPHTLDYVLMNEIYTRGVISPKMMRRYIGLAGNSCGNDRRGLMEAFCRAVKTLRGARMAETAKIDPAKNERQPQPLLID